MFGLNLPASQHVTYLEVSDEPPHPLHKYNYFHVVEKKVKNKLNKYTKLIALKRGALACYIQLIID